MGCRAPSQALQMLRQLFARAMKRALHRAHRQSRYLRNLVVVELSLVSKRDDFAIFRPKPPDRRLQNPREVGIFSQGSRRRRLDIGELPPPLAILSHLLE